MINMKLDWLKFEMNIEQVLMGVKSTTIPGWTCEMAMMTACDVSSDN